MKISLNWLKRYVDLTASAQEIAEVLPMLGLEVESVRQVGLPPIENLVVGEVLSREQHPNADRLGVCQVKVHPDQDPIQIVCGASNYKVGDRVPVALVGCVLPGDFKIKKSKLRGVESNGMMCSARELGLGEDHSGLMILEGCPEVGTPMNQVITDNDTIFELELTANRGDCLSHVGVARELAAYYGLKLKLPEVPVREGSGEGLLADVSIETDTCALYIALSIRGVKVGPSPEWLKKALESVGLRSINNVVDVTNFVMLEGGQPLHAFDAAKIRGRKLIVRNAGAGETITTLDGKVRNLDAGMAVIADAERPLVIAGVMGSVDAEVDDSTVDVVLESAWFLPGSVRQTTRKLNLHTDSSHRFTRDVDPGKVLFWSRRALELILEVAGGEVVGPVIERGKAPREDRTITLSPNYVREVCGFDVSDETIRDIYVRLGFDVDTQSVGEWRVTVPSFRSEVDRPIDLVEEFIRFHGTANIPESIVQGPGLSREDDPLSVYNRKATDYLVGQHFNECYHYSLMDGTVIDRWYQADMAEYLKLANPLTSEQSHLRLSLLPGLLESLRNNLNNENPVERLFEVGRVFREAEGELWELASVAFVVVVDSEERHWRTRSVPDFYTARNWLAHLAALAGIEALDFALVDPSRLCWQPGHAATASCWFKNGYMANAGLINMALLKEMDIEGRVLAGELFFKPEILKKKRKVTRFQAFSSFPPTIKDLALVVDEGIPAETVRRDLETVSREQAGGAFAVEQVKLFDLYQGKGLPEGKKSLTFSLQFRSPERTLSDKETKPVFDGIQKAIQEKGYAIR